MNNADKHITLDNIRTLWQADDATLAQCTTIMTQIRDEFLVNEIELLYDWNRSELIDIIADLWRGDTTPLHDMPDRDVLRDCCECAQCGDDIVDHLDTAVESDGCIHCAPACAALTAGNEIPD